MYPASRRESSTRFIEAPAKSGGESDHVLARLLAGSDFNEAPAKSGGGGMANDVWIQLQLDQLQ